MRLRHIPEARGVVERSPYVVKNPETLKGQWRAYFEEHRRENRATTEEETAGRLLYVEIGMGKGRFAVDMALAHPEADFLGIERYDSVLFRACERMAGIPYHTQRDQLERAEQPEELLIPDNLHFLSIDARELPELFAEGEIDGIYLNFSDPWPKARHAGRRLTSGNFLGLYARCLKDGGRLEFKTDNTGLFAFSVEEVREAADWELVAETWDLHRDPVLSEGNIMTEYERKFSALGNRICKLAALYHRPERREEPSGAELAWKLQSTEHLVQDGWIDFRRSTYEMPDGRLLGPFYTYSRRSYTVIVPVDEEGRFLCVRQFRQGIGEVTTEFPAGGIETGEEASYVDESGEGEVVRVDREADTDILAAAKRELLEETGCVSDHWEHLLSVPSNATVSDNWAHIYLARGCTRVGEQSLDSTEFLHTVRLTAEEIDRLIAEGGFQQAIHILAYKLAAERL